MQVYSFGHRAPIKSRERFGNTPPVTNNDALALKKAFGSLVLGKPNAGMEELSQSQFEVNGIGVGALGNTPALAVFTKTEPGKQALEQALVKLPGFEARAASPDPAVNQDKDTVGTLTFKGKKIPVMLIHCGPFRLY